MKELNQFSFFLDTKIEFGVGKINNLCEYIEGIKGSKIMIITDEGLVKIGILKPIIDILNKNNIPSILYTDVQPDPTVKIVDRAGKLCREEKCDVIIAVGGGSSMDTAKGASVVASNDRSCYDYLDGRGEEKKRIDKEPIPIIAIPTTAGTGSEVSQYAVITHSNIKDSISSYEIYPKIAVIDADLMKNLPPTITAYTGMDALGHAIEGYTSKIENAFTDILALEAIKLIFENLSNCIKGRDIESRANMALGALLAGIAMSHCGGTLPHAMGCPLSGHCKVPHGLSVGLLQVPMMELNKELLKDKFKKILNYVEPSTLHLSEEECSNKLIEKVKELMKEIGIKETINIVDISEEIIDNMIEDALIHGCSSLNAKEMTREKISEIYKKLISDN